MEELKVILSEVAVSHFVNKSFLDRKMLRFLIKDLTCLECEQEFVEDCYQMSRLLFDIREFSESQTV